MGEIDQKYSTFDVSCCKEKYPVSETGFDFYVNIRTAQLFQDQIVFYAGAGITEDSVAEAEWKETEAKCDNLALKLID